MKTSEPQTLHLDHSGRLVFTEELKKRWGFDQGTAVVIRQTPHGLMLFPQDPPLAKVYIEPTSVCNLNCRSCMRHAWDEPTGTMTMATFSRLIESLRRVPSFGAMSFWGMGEPLLHPQIASMVAAAKKLGADTELITNGLLLDAAKAGALIEAGLDRLIVSVDGANPKSHAENRTGADLDRVKSNIKELRRLRRERRCEKPEIGIEFVLMRHNIDEVRQLRRLALEMGAGFIILTNVLPYAKELKEEILYWMSADRPWSNGTSVFSPKISVPRVDARREHLDALNDLLWSGCAAEPVQRIPRNPDADGHCRFVEQGAAVVAWDGEVSPCVALMHSYRCFVLDREKTIRRYTLGNVASEDILQIWNKAEYKGFRKRVLDFDFSPCVHCGGCDFSESNQEDCFGNPFPTCGDCLWARNIIVCP